VLHEGDRLALDGTTGVVTIDDVPLVDPEVDENFQQVLAWADEIRRLGVRANADAPEDARKAREFGAEGIGLCRTEHMFMAADRQPKMQAMILASSTEDRRRALDELLPLQREDFEALFEAMEGRPVTIRLLDPPLHEFLPHSAGEIEEVAVALGKPAAHVAAKVTELTEANPMLGHRGCRLAITFPEIYEIQARAIGEAAAEVARAGISVHPEIMIPLVMHPEELRRLRELVSRTFNEALGGANIAYTIGTMIELPRACVRADEIAEHADFFSFGTNDLTQTALGFSRDDAEGKFLTYYLQHGVLEQNPFETLDRSGVGELMRIAVERGRSVKDDLKMGICGEHGGEAKSVAFCDELGLDYVSCSPYRVPLARLAAAQAALAATGAAAYVAAGG
ncbi:MAG: putative PEP-binding protein, partial [Gaiellaceae bacterium]